MIVLYLFLGWFIPTLIHIIWLYYDMEKGESIEEFIGSIDKEDIVIGFYTCFEYSYFNSALNVSYN